MTADIYVTHMCKVIYVTYMQFLITAVLHVCNIYVEIAAPSYIYVTCMYIYVTYMCGNGRYVTYMSHICRFGKGGYMAVLHFVPEKIVRLCKGLLCVATGRQLRFA